MFDIISRNDIINLWEIIKRGVKIYEKVSWDKEDTDLTRDSRDAARVMTPLCGGINGDEMINDSGLIILWQAVNDNREPAVVA